MDELGFRDSNVRIRFTDDYSVGKLTDFTRELLVDESLVKAVRTNPVDELKEIGIEIIAGDLAQITDEDLLVALGRRAAPGEMKPFGGPAFVVAVIIGVINSP